MIVESMNDREFVLEVVRDYFDELGSHVMTNYSEISNRDVNNYTSKRGNKWLIVSRPDYEGQCSLHIKRLQPKKWFTWYSLVLSPPHRITLIGFNKHVAERISQRYNPELKPSEALEEMMVKTPAIIQGDTGKEFYTRVNGGICIGPVHGKLITIDIGNRRGIGVELRETKTFVSDDLLYNDQKKITEESITRAIEKLGKNYLSDHDLDQ